MIKEHVVGQVGVVDFVLDLSECFIEHGPLVLGATNLLHLTLIELQ